MRIILLCVIFIYGLVKIDAIAENIQKWVKGRFLSPTGKMFYEHWKKYRKPIENSLQIMLKETFGKQSMNIYVKKTPNARRVAEGFFVSDNIVNVLFKDLYLTEFPHLTTPEVSFAMASNVLRVDADVHRMIVDAKYLLFRNLSDVAYSVGKFDPYINSPFSLQQVSNDGQGTIVADGCVLSGFAMPTLQAQSVHLGHNFFRLRNCKYSVEISTPDNGSPPVIAPYLSEAQTTQLGLLLVKPIQEELMTKLQGAMLTYVNTSAIFGQNLPKIRQHQQATFATISNFITQVVANLNEETLAVNRGVMKLNDEIFSWTDKYKEKVQESKVTIANMTLRGLDSAYSAQTGGPFRMPDFKIEETIRIADLQVRGSIIYQVNSKKSEFVFYGVIQDLQAHVSISTETDKTIYKVEIIGWRHLDLHTPNLPVIASQSLVSGVLMNKIPIMVMKHLSQYLGDAIALASKDPRWGGADKHSKPKEQDESYNNRDNDENVEQNKNGGYSGKEETPQENMDDNFSAREDVTQKSMLGKPMFNKPMFEKPMFQKPMFEKPMFGNEPPDAHADDGPVEGSLTSDNPQDQYEGTIENEDGGDVHYEDNETQRTTKSMLGKPMFEKPMFDQPMFKKPAFEEPMFGNPSDVNVDDGPVEGSPISDNPQDQDVGEIEIEELGDVNYEENETQRNVDGSDNEKFQENIRDNSSGREDVKQKSMLGKPMFEKPMFNEPMFKKPAFGKPVFGNTNPSDALVANGTAEGSLLPANLEDQDVGRIENEGDDVENVDGADSENVQENIDHNTRNGEDVPQKSMLGKPMFRKPMFEVSKFKEKPLVGYNPNRNGKKKLDSKGQDLDGSKNEEKTDDENVNGKVKDSASGGEGVPQKSMLGTPMFGRPMFGSGSILRSQRDKIMKKNNNNGNVKGNRETYKQKDEVKKRKLIQRRAQDKRKKYLNTNKPRNVTQYEKQARISDNEIHSE